jgi:hypothetical protein
LNEPSSDDPEDGDYQDDTSSDQSDAGCQAGSDSDPRCVRQGRAGAQLVGGPTDECLRQLLFVSELVTAQPTSARSRKDGDKGGGEVWSRRKSVKVCDFI